MKYQTIISLILLPQLAPVLGAAVTIPNNDASLQNRNIKSVLNKLGHLKEEKVKALKVVGEGVKVAVKGAKIAGNGIKVAGSKAVETVGKGVKIVGQEIKNIEEKLEESFTPWPGLEGDWDELSDILPSCAQDDCKNKFFINEALRWIKHALKDVGMVVREHPMATAALVIGVSFLLTELISGGMLVPIGLRVIGFGVKGPIKNTIAAAVQRVINPIKLKSAFSQLQSAAMGGVALRQLQTVAHLVIAGLIGGAVTELVDGVKPHGHSPHFQGWRKWELESRTDTLVNAARYWGSLTYGGCVAYGYRDIRAPMLSIPVDMDARAACAITPTSIVGIGYKTPLDCVDEGPEKGIIGKWYVPTNEAQCMPKWSTFEDEGCMLYGRRRKFARLMGLENNGDWKGMCESTPAIIDSRYYNRPSHCDDKGGLGIYGVFDIKDEQCECSCVHP